MNLLGYEHSCNSPGFAKPNQAGERRGVCRGISGGKLFRRVSRWEGLGQRHDREGRLACSAEDPLCASDSHPLRHPILAWRRYLAGCSFSYTAGVPFAVIFAMPHEGRFMSSTMRAVRFLAKFPSFMARSSFVPPFSADLWSRRVLPDGGLRPAAAMRVFAIGLSALLALPPPSGRTEP